MTKTALRRPAKKIKTLTVGAITKLLDKAFSIKVRQKSMDSQGFVACYTCGHKNHWKKMQCGHYLSRFYKATRWDYDNARPQCMMCNLWKRGDPIVFRANLIKEIGVERVEAVESKRFALFKQPIGLYQNKLIEINEIQLIHT